MQDKFFADSWAAATHEIISYGDVPCGYLHIEHRANDIQIHELVIDPEFQGNGIGSHILRETMGIAGTRSIPIHLRVLRLNRAANLYRRLGFREIGTTDTHVLMEWRSL